MGGNWYQLVDDNWLLTIGGWQLVGDNWFGGSWLVAIGWWQPWSAPSAAPATQITAAQRRRPSDTKAAPGRTSDPGEHQNTAPAKSQQHSRKCHTNHSGTVAETQRHQGSTGQHRGVHPNPWRTKYCACHANNWLVTIG